MSVLLALVFLFFSSARWTAAEEPWTLTLFLSPGCQYNEHAVRAVTAFLRRHPDVKGHGVLIASLSELTDIRTHAQALAGSGLAFAVDAAASTTHGITETPAVVFHKGERKVCIRGRSDLERVWESIHEENR